MPQYFQEGNIPSQADTVEQSLQKINALTIDDSDVVQFGTNILATSAANGTDWVAFPDTPCKQITVVNLSGVNMDFKRNAETIFFTTISVMFWTFRGLTNAKQISMRRTDTSTSQISIVAEAEG